ncbi:MAG: ABC transporter permease [Clostridia bacterium]|nr:ABC transporter permease [Clostridia bacterium]
MTEQKKKAREPLFHIVKRAELPLFQAWGIRVLAVLAALILNALILMILTGQNPLAIYGSMFSGAFGTARRIWNLFQALAMLLMVSLAVTPAFKMRFWNIGAEGQVLVGGLATAAVMFYFGGKMPTWLLFVTMTAASVLAGIVWAVIPAVFRAKWKINETLFTLMMNYIAIQLVSFFINTWVTSGSGTLSPMSEYGFPKVGPSAYFLNIMIVLVFTVVMYIYLRFTKHGYEIAVVGESEKTAMYIGVNVKKVVVRTMVLSGALCGVAGLLLVGGTSHTISTSTAGGRGFTAIIVSWLAKFDPLYMILTAFLVVFLQAGSAQIVTDFRIDSAISDIVTAVILFFIIGCEFFINYRITRSERG